MITAAVAVRVGPASRAGPPDSPGAPEPGYDDSHDSPHGERQSQSSSPPFSACRCSAIRRATSNSSAPPRSAPTARRLLAYFRQRTVTTADRQRIEDADPPARRPGLRRPRAGDGRPGRLRSAGNRTVAAGPVRPGCRDRPAGRPLPGADRAGAEPASRRPRPASVGPAEAGRGGRRVARLFAGRGRRGRRRRGPRSARGGGSCRTAGPIPLWPGPWTMPNPLVRGAAAEALARSGAPAAVEIAPQGAVRRQCRRPPADGAGARHQGQGQIGRPGR